MRPCQKKHFIQKIDSYQESINKCNINIEDQRKRIDCFQGLINQLRAVINDDTDDTP
jgi:peptidoglycan hydrolase CwlO-like protein